LEEVEMRGRLIERLKERRQVERLREMRLLTLKKIILKVMDAETKEALDDALVMGIKLLIPSLITPRRTNEKGEVKIYTMMRFLVATIFKRGYRTTLWFQALTDERTQIYEVTLEKRPG